MKWDRIRKDLEDGLNSIQAIGRFLAQRTRVETSLAKVVYDTQKIRRKIDEKYHELGERIYELKDEKNPSDNATVRDLISDLSSLKEELDFYMTRASELGGQPPDEQAEGEEAPPPSEETKQV
ncbi:MAG: hypothetical protein ACWGSD_13200 [Thermodesulfobacteriota bacterium]